jgi:hypothetical protein
MASLDMNGPYSLTEMKIDTYVSESIGNYALGYTDDGGVFRVLYVGRSDTNLNQRLKDHIDEGFREFKFSIAATKKAAYTKECQNYHDFNPKNNEIHPAKPTGLDSLECPVCGQ